MIQGHLRKWYPVGLELLEELLRIELVQDDHLATRPEQWPHRHVQGVDVVKGQHADGGLLEVV